MCDAVHTPTMESMGSSTESDAWRDVLLSLESHGSGEELLAALFAEDGVSDEANGQTVWSTDALSPVPSEASDGSLTKRVRLPDSWRSRCGNEGFGDGEMPTKKKKKKRSSTTMKQNLQLLRDAVRDAEAHVQLLQSRRHQQRNTRRDDAVHAPADAVQVCVWKDVAARQYRWRRESENENRRLQTLLQAQTRTMQALQRLLTRGFSTSYLPVTGATFDIEGARYARRVDELKAATSEMPGQMQLGLVPHLPGINGDMMITESDQRIVPCSPESVTSAVWNYICRASTETESYFRERIDVSSDWVVKSFHLRWKNVAHCVDHRGLVVARCFPQQNGLDLVVYSAELEPLEPEATAHHDSSTVSHGFRTHVWTGVGRSSHGTKQSQVIIKNVTRPFAGPLTPVSKPPSVVRRLAQFCLDRHLERVHRAIDSAFLPTM